jgi:hypothetical protein
MTPYKDRLSKNELGELLRIIADGLRDRGDVSIITLINYLQRFPNPAKSGSFEASQFPDKYYYVDFTNRFRTSEEFRELLQVVYKKRIPYRISKEIMKYLGIGIMFSSDISTNEALSLWERRNLTLSSINIYQMKETDLYEKLNDPSLFPDGYSIGSFARKFHIILPKTENRDLPIRILMEKVFERPSSSKSIGRWGLPEQEKK